MKDYTRRCIVKTASSLELYRSYVREMSVIERLRLVRLILDDLMATSQTWLVDESDAWSDEDVEDLTRYTLTYATRSLGE
jgi:hypothetical protein